jgi:hypothetical protein
VRAVRALGLLAVGIVACGTQSNDDPKPYAIPSPAGKGNRIREIVNPKSDKHAQNKQSVSVSGAAVVHVDTFDETQNGKSTGTIYVQDVGSKEPFSGISLFAPTFVPGNLRVGPGDVLQMTGQFQENTNIGAANFADGTALTQISQPTATFMFETTPVDPVEIDLAELSDWDKGRRWIGMLVRVKNVRIRDLGKQPDQQNRYSQDLHDPPPGFKNACNAPFPRPASMPNELFDLYGYISKLAADPGFAANPTFKSVTGVVTFFCNLHLSPRSAADFER